MPCMRCIHIAFGRFLLIECSVHFILGVASHRRALLTDLHPPPPFFGEAIPTQYQFSYVFFIYFRPPESHWAFERAKIHPLWSLLGLSVYFKPTADIIARKGSVVRI